MFIEFDRVSKRFERARTADKQAFVAVQSISLGVDKGKMLALVGASGSGKTTLLRCLAGLEKPDQGRIRIGERDVFSSEANIDVPVERRDVGLIFQTYALWPHLTVERNVAYPLERRKLSSTERAARVTKYLELVDCAHLASRYPHELSGGQQQRISLARALVYEPAVVLFDEPLSNLDPALRERLRAEIRDLQRELGFTGIYVTHDQGEAFYLGDQIAFLNQGALLQLGDADQIHGEPRHEMVARFSGATNASRGELEEGGRRFVSPDLGKIMLAKRHALEGMAARFVFLVRPETTRLVAESPDKPRAKVLDRTIVGELREYTVQFASGARWRARVNRSAPRLNVGDTVGIEIDESGAFLFAEQPAPQRIDP